MPYPEPKDRAATRVGRANVRSGTRPEVALRSQLHRRGMRFRKDFAINTGQSKPHADAAFTRVRVAVFVDGCFWHCCPLHQVHPKTNADYWRPKLERNVERDRQVDEALASAGWLVVRVWEHEDAEKAAVMIEELVRKRAELA